MVVVQRTQDVVVALFLKVVAWMALQRPDSFQSDRCCFAWSVVSVVHLTCGLIEKASTVLQQQPTTTTSQAAQRTKTFLSFDHYQLP